MTNEHYPQCRTLPAINETFPQFSRPGTLLSPLDLSLRASNLIPITPPSTPSPPRKRQRLMSDESYLWRPHVMGTAALMPSAAAATTTTTSSTATSAGNFFSLSYACRDELSQTSNGYKNNLLDSRNNFEEIPEIQSGAAVEQQTPSQQQEQHQSERATIYVDDETIVLTEDEDETTLVSSHDYTEEDAEEYIDDDLDADVDEDVGLGVETNGTASGNEDIGEDNEEEYVDILSNDDDEVNPLSANAILTLQSQANAAAEELEENSDKVLTRNKLVYENEELHNKAVDGLAKLFERDFQPPLSNESTINEFATTGTEKTYTDLTSCSHVRRSELNDESVRATETTPEMTSRQVMTAPTSSTPTSHVHNKAPHRAERKRTKLRKNLSLDEETLSPVSGTIIRKLRDDEELVVRKGDIDPAFNVVEITEEAKAILASIDNKIGEYLCQLCRTLYDDAFMLAQHRCPRIVHIEYKCSECEKVFNCPANLASHRRWHKPKSELLANSQNKKRQATEQTGNMSSTHDKSNTDESAEGIFPCPQCGKTFRRHAYLKKHQASHQMLDNLKSLDIFKNNSTASSFSHAGAHQQAHAIFGAGGISAGTTHHRSAQNGIYHANTSSPSTSTTTNHHSIKPYPQRFVGGGTFPFVPFDQRRFYSLGELYLSQQLERSSAFQYVQQANHLRNLSSAAAAGNFVPRPMMPSQPQLMSSSSVMSVK